jgi:adenylate cyclase
MAAHEIVRSLAALSQALIEELAAPRQVGIGIHAGPAIVGQMGYGAALYLTAVGDTVNVASRLERLTREAGTPLIVSEALVIAVRGCGGEALLERMRPDQAHTVRGRREPVAIWCLAVAR